MPSQSVVAFLRSLKSRNLAENVPSISESTANLLSSLVARRQTRTLLELGTAHGYSTVALASAMSENSPDFRIVTVDFSKPSFEAAKDNVKEAGFSANVVHVFDDALAYVPTLDGESFDAVFLDAEKRSTARLFALAWPLVREGGWLVVDDVVKFRDKMADFYALLESQKIPHETVMTDPDDGVMVFFKDSSE